MTAYTATIGYLNRGFGITYEMIDLLLKAGAKSNIKDKKSKTSLDYINNRSHVDVSGKIKDLLLQSSK